MYISRIKLINWLGIFIGQQCETFEIHMNNRFPITLIRGDNGYGKTALLSALSSPYPYDGGFDNRGSAAIIRKGYLGEKEIDYVDGNTIYTVHIYYKPNAAGSHSTKCHITKNGVELNPNGNVSSYEPLIEEIFGVSEKDLMLVRIGTNMASFISLSSMDRKKYLSRLIGDVDVYLSMYQMISYDIRTNRAIISGYSEEMAKLGIDDIAYVIKLNIKRKDKVQKLLMDIGRLKGERDSLADMTADIDALIAERSSLLTKVNFVENISAELRKSPIDSLRSKRKTLQTQLDAAQARYNDLKSNIDANNRGIEFAKIDLSKLSIDDSVSDKRSALEAEIEKLSSQYGKIKVNISSKDYNIIYQSITQIRTLLQVVTNYELRVVEKIIELYGDATDVDSWYEESMTSIIDPESKLSMEQYLQRVVQDGFHVPDCADVNCAYRRLGEMISSKDTSEMTIDFIRDVKQGLSVFIRAVDLLAKIPQSLPKQLLSIIEARNILDLVSKSEVFGIEPFDNYRSIIYGYESYQQKLTQLEVYKQQESSKQRMIIMRGDIEARIRQFTDSNNTLITKMSAQKTSIDKLAEELTSLDVLIGKRIEYDNIKDELPSYNRRLKDLNSQIENVSTRRSKINMLNSSIQLHSDELEKLQEDVSETDTAITLYQKYHSEINRLDKLITEQNKILRNVSAKDEGIPLLYMKIFFEKIRQKCNELLAISYGDTLTIGKFDTESPEFNIPYIRNGNWVRDIKTASQGELPMVTLALSFAMASLVKDKKLNIIFCDEVDSTFDITRKYNYLEMLDQHIFIMGIEQAFVISHSEALDSIPTNLIDMQDGLPITRGSNKYKILRS